MPTGMPELASAIVVGLEGSENFRRAREGMKQVRGAMGRMNAATGGMTKAWGQATKALTVGARALGTVWGWLRRIAAIGAGVFAGVAGGLTLMARKAVMAQSSLEDIQTMLATAFGSAAQRAFAAAEQFSIKTPFTPEAVARGAIFLKQLKVVPNAGKDLVKWMRLAGDMAGSMKRDFLEAVFAIGFGLSGESDRLKQFGITVRDLIEAGALGKLGQGINIRTAEGGRRFLEAMEKIISSRFGGGAASLAKTLSGLFSTFQGIMQFVWADVAQAGGKRGLFEQMKGLVGDANRVLGNMRGWREFRRVTQQLGTSFGVIVRHVRSWFREDKLKAWLATVGDKLVGLPEKLKSALTTMSGLASAAASLAASTLPKWAEGLTQWLEKLTGMDMATWSSNFVLGLTRIEVAAWSLLEKLSAVVMIGGVVGVIATGGTNIPAWGVTVGSAAGASWIIKQKEQAQAQVKALEAAGLKGRAPGTAGAGLGGAAGAAVAAGAMPDFREQFPKMPKRGIRAMQQNWELAETLLAGRQAYAGGTAFQGDPRLEAMRKRRQALGGDASGEPRVPSLDFERRMAAQGRYPANYIRVEVRSHDPAVVARAAGEAVRKETEQKMRAMKAPG